MNAPASPPWQDGEESYGAALSKGIVSVHGAIITGRPGGEYQEVSPFGCLPPSLYAFVSYYMYSIVLSFYHLPYYK